MPKARVGVVTKVLRCKAFLSLPLWPGFAAFRLTYCDGECIMCGETLNLFPRRAKIRCCHNRLSILIGNLLLSSAI